MNPFLLSEKERMLSWRELRNQISALPDDEKFEPLLRWWAKAPICAYAIDAYDCAQWPTPWELLNENMFCTSAVAYLMAQTLILSGVNEARIMLTCIKGNDDERLIVVVDDSIVLNYSYGEVFAWADIKDEFVERQSYRFVEAKAIPVNQTAV